MFGIRRRDWRDLGRPGGARFYCNTAARGSRRTEWRGRFFDWPGGHANLSGARMRWRIASAPSLANALDPKAPGAPAWDAELFRARGFMPGSGASLAMRNTRMVSHDRAADRLDLVAAAGDRALVEGQRRVGCAERPACRAGRRGGARAMVHAATTAAGVRRGTRLTDARALDPGLEAVAADVAGDADLLARLARWASRWSPLVEVDGEDGLRMDVAGVAHLFGGEAGLCRDIETRFSAMGLTACVALAESAGAAWGLARFGGDRLPGKALADRLAPLPVAALRLGPGPTRTLELLGLKTIGALAGVPRRSLARRFREADNPLDALDRMLGRKAEPLTAAPFEAPPRASSGWPSRSPIRARRPRRSTC